jgi:hypothetical protein
MQGHERTYRDIKENVGPCMEYRNAREYKGIQGNTEEYNRIVGNTE